MSSFPPHSGEAPRQLGADARVGDAWEASARPEADAYPYTLRELRNHLERLGYRARTGGVGGEDVREMQARVAELRTSLAQDSARQERRHEARYQGPGADHEAQTQHYERRIQAALADMASQLRGGPQEASETSSATARLDVTTRAWLDQRFDTMRGQLEEALRNAAPPPPREDICLALEEARKRLSAMERKIEDNVRHQQKTTAKILGVIEPHEDQQSAIATQPDPSLARLDDRLQSLQNNFDRAMNELEAMKAGAQRLAIRASATVARQTARATAQHVAKAVREAAPERRFARLDESISGCMNETRALSHKTGVMQRALEDGLDDLRGRINELTLITRKALATATPIPSGAAPQDVTDAARVGGWQVPNMPTSAPRTSAPQARARNASPWWEAPMREVQTSRTGPSSSFVSKLGFALVIVLMIAASFAMLYAQISDQDSQLVTPPEGIAPTSTLPDDERSTRRPITVEDGGTGTVILPGVILTEGTGA